MHRLLALWRARFRLAAFALTRFRPMVGADDGGDGGDGGTGGEGGDGGGSGGGGADKTFTQADLDRIVQERLAREAKKYEGFDDLKSKAAEFDKLQEQQLSELEREKKAREKAEADAAKRIQTADQRLIEAAVLAAATQAKALKPEHLHKLIDTGKVTVADDGQVTGAQDAVKAFLDANPEYVGNGQPKGDADQGARKAAPNQLTREALANMSPTEIVTAQKEGRLNSLLGAS